MGVFLLLHLYVVEEYYKGLLFFSLESFYIFHSLCAIGVCGLLLLPIGGNMYIGYRFIVLTFFADVGLLSIPASSTAFPAQGRGVGDPLFHVRFLCSTFFGGVFCYFAT